MKDFISVSSLISNLLKKVSSETNFPLNSKSQLFDLKFPDAEKDPLKSYPIASEIEEGRGSLRSDTSTLVME